MQRWFLILGVVAVASVPAPAHHSFSDFYLEEDTIEVEGEVLEFQYRNPHSWVHIAATDPFGQRKQYAAEWVSTSRLEREGITKAHLRPGEMVRIWGSPNRNPNDTRIRLKRIERRSPRWEWGQLRRETR
jgi:hypothetical protein